MRSLGRWCQQQNPLQLIQAQGLLRVPQGGEDGRIRLDAASGGRLQELPQAPAMASRPEHSASTTACASSPASIPGNSVRIKVSCKCTWGGPTAWSLEPGAWSKVQEGAGVSELRSCWSSSEEAILPWETAQRGEGPRKARRASRPLTLGSREGGALVLTQPPSQHQGEGSFGLGAS